MPVPSHLMFAPQHRRAGFPPYGIACQPRRGLPADGRLCAGAAPRRGQRRSVSVRGSAAPWGRALPRVHAVTGSPGHGPDVPGQAHRRRPRFPTEAEPGARTEEPTLLASARSRRLLLASAAATLLCGRTGSAQPAPGSGAPTATNPEKTRTDRERTNSPKARPFPGHWAHTPYAARWGFAGDPMRPSQKR